MFSRGVRLLRSHVPALGAAAVLGGVSVLADAHAGTSCASTNQCACARSCSSSNAAPPTGWLAKSMQKDMPQISWDPNWDFRAPASAANDTASDGDAPKRRKGSRYIILVRHGQYVSRDPGLKDELDCEEDFLHNDPLRPLTELGRSQADVVGRALASMLPDAELKRAGTTLRVYCSDMSRAHETGRIIHQHIAHLGARKEEDAAATAAPVPLHVDSLLREGAPMMPEGYSGPWQPEDHEFHSEAARIEAAFRKHIHRAPPHQEHDSVDVIVCHGNVIRYFLVRALQLPPASWLRFSLHNASVTRLVIRPSGSVSVRAVGETMAMPAAMVTYH